MTKILLVAGHGDGDPGAVSNGIREADLTRELVQGIEKKLGGAAEVFDTAKNMYKFLKAGESYDFSGYDYILELHFNAGAVNVANGVTTGTEQLIHSDAVPSAADSLILKRLAEIGFRNRGIKRRSDLQNMNIIKRRGKQYALLEVCFIDDPDDMQIYNSNKNRIAEAIAGGIMEGLGISQSEELTSVNDIVWELAERGIIADKELWLKKLEEDGNAYWLARKTAAYLRGKRV